MDRVPFETISAWRIGWLRATLLDAEQRGANLYDDGHDLLHCALQRRFALARGRVKDAPSPAPRLETTRKVRSFAHLKLVIIWCAYPELSLLGLEAGRQGAVWLHPQGA